jgi:hypothetical protein
MELLWQNARHDYTMLYVIHKMGALWADCRLMFDDGL